MIRLVDLLPKHLHLMEGSSVPGAMEGWLAPEGVCHYVVDTHSEWIARKMKLKPADKTDIGEYEGQRMDLMRLLYDKGWSRIIIKHGDNILYFDTYDTPWTSLGGLQRSWLINASVHGVRVAGEKIKVGEKEEYRVPPYKIEFGNTGKTISPEQLGAR